MPGFPEVRRLRSTLQFRGYMETDTKAQLETNLYSTATDDAQLAWTGTSTIVDPRSPTSAINDVVKQVVEQLQKQNLI